MAIFIKDKNEIHPFGSFYKIALSDKLYDPKTSEPVWIIKGYKNDGKVIKIGSFNNENEAKKLFNTLFHLIDDNEKMCII